MRATGERDERVEITWMRVLVAYVQNSPPLFRPPPKLYYLVLEASYRLFDHMKTWAPSPLSLQPNERGGHGNGNEDFAAPSAAFLKILVAERL